MQNQAQGLEKPTPEMQAQYDKLIAKAIKLVHSEAKSKLVAVTQKGDLVIGLKASAEAIMNKLGEAAQQQGIVIPTKMRPSLALEMISEIALLVEQETGTEISDDVIVGAFQLFIQEEMEDALEIGDITPEQLDAEVQKLSGGIATSQTQEAPQQAQQEVPVEDPRAGGLL